LDRLPFENEKFRTHILKIELMNQDNYVRVLLFLCTLVVLLVAAYLAGPIIAPVTMALFVVAIVWPLQSALQKRIPKALPSSSHYFRPLPSLRYSVFW
jgi:predicted PurR-regulated permease PerM